MVGRKKFGVFPLRGKVPNVRSKSEAKIEKNAEFKAIKKILGLRQDHDDVDMNTRYMHMMIMTDQDHDGSHIKGLLINMFHYYW